MRSFKKLVACAASIATLAAMSITAFAGTISADEQKILDALKTANVPAQYVTEAQNYLAGDDVEITAAQADVVIAQVNEAKTIAGDATDFKSLSADQKQKIANCMATAGAEIGITVTYDASADKITAVDASGKTIFTASAKSSSDNGDDTIIKTTGVNMYATVSIVAVLAAALVACGIVVSKKTANHNA